jgi:EmrB/QacA subfamily drug resistance transporter
MTETRTAHAPAATNDDAISARAWKVLALVSASMFVIILDNNAVNVAFPFIERTFSDTPRSTLAWLSSGYAICAAALLLVAGRLADRHGRRRVFSIGMATFVVASTLTAAAPNPALLIAARLVQGAGAALLYSTAVALILPEFPASKRGLALGIWGTVGSAGAAAGPTLGALAIEAVNWRLVFLLNLPIGVAALVLGPRVLQETTTDDGSARIDVLSTLLGTAGIALFTLAILQGPRWGWASTAVIGSLVLSVVLVAAMVWRCARTTSPLLDLGLFSDRRFTVANLSQAGTQLAIFAWFFTTPLFLINVWHYSALAGGTAVAIGMVASFVSIPVGHWSDRHGYRGMLIAGGLVSAAAMGYWVVAVDAEPHFWQDYFPGLVIFGVGAGMVGIVVTNAALASLPERELASANATFQMIRRLVGAIGVAIAVAILGDRTTESVAAFRGTWVMIAIGYLFSVVAALAYPGERATRRR